MYLGFEYEALRVYEQVALAAPNLLAAVVSPLLSSHAGGLRGLRIHDGSAGQRVSTRTDPQDLAQRSVELARESVRGQMRPEDDTLLIKENIGDLRRTTV